MAAFSPLTARHMTIHIGLPPLDLTVSGQRPLMSSSYSATIDMTRSRTVELSDLCGNQPSNLSSSVDIGQ